MNIKNSKSFNKNKDEAEEHNIYYDKNNGDTSSEGEGDDLLDNIEDDYKKIDHLDKYEEDGIDNEDMSEMDESDRRRADEELDERDKKDRFLTSRIPAALLRDMEENSDEEEYRRHLRSKKLKFVNEDFKEKEDISVANEKYVDPKDVKGKERDWLKEPSNQRKIYGLFGKFIKTFKEDGKAIYEERIVNMCTNNKQSLEVNYSHLSKADPTIAVWAAFYPKIILPIFDDAVFEIIMEIVPNYINIQNEIFVRIKDLPVEDSLRNLRYKNLDSLVKVRGVITKRSGLFPQMKKINFFCENCGEKKGPVFFNGNDDIQLGSCNYCSKKGPFKVVVEDTVYRNYQKITIQESPGSVPPGRIPRYKEVILTNDLVDSVRPGDEVEICAVYCSRYDLSNNIKHSFPVFSTFLEANYIKRFNELEADELTDEDKYEIRKLAHTKNISQLIFNSIANSIYGHSFIKKAITIAMFGGMPKDVNDKHKIRGDINVLILGDPGLAKSQFLKYIQKVFHRSVYTTGKGASAVGLTAGVHKDPVSKEWVLEGGALVLADKGICLIDEFDKMNDQDRTSIHEAMEQQSISISKAGIVTSLLARCSIIAAANPISGRYNERENFQDNVDLTEPILSRFDILCVVKDDIDFEIDKALSTFVINSHISSHPDKDFNEEHKLEELLLKDIESNMMQLGIEEMQKSNYNYSKSTYKSINSNNDILKEKSVISQETLKKYIKYARRYVHPKLSDLNKQKISKFYAELRKESENIGGIPIAVRHFESIIRISEAHARMHLREYIRNDDIDFGIKIMLESFIMSQKHSIAKSMKKKFNNYLIHNEDHTQILNNILNRVLKEHVNYGKLLNKDYIIPETIEINKDTFEREAKDFGIYSYNDFYNSSIFKANNKLLSSTIMHYTKIK